MAVSALDPSFGAGGVVLGAVDTGTGTALSNATAVAVQADGKIVVVGTFGIPTGTNFDPSALAARRYDADGSIDTTFGTKGEADIPLPSGYSQVNGAPRNVVVLSDGSIAFVAGLYGSTTSSSGTVTSQTESIVVELTAAGQLNPSFATAGEFTVPPAAGAVSALAVQSDGAIVLGGATIQSPDALAASYMLTATRLTAVGALDTTFNGTGELTFKPNQTAPYSTATISSVAITPGGQIVLGGNSSVSDFSPKLYESGILARVNSNGTLDTTFGTSGFLSLATVPGFDILGTMAIQADGKIVVAGSNNSIYTSGAVNLIRLLPDGTVDSSFLGHVTTTAASLFPDNTLTALAINSTGEITLGGSSSSSSGVVTPLVERFTSSGVADSTFGIAGRTSFHVASTISTTGAASSILNQINGIALTASGDIIVVGSANTNTASQSLVAQLLPIQVRSVAGDYDGDGKADVAAELAALGLFAYRPSGGGANVVESFGPAALGSVIPAPGDYDGDGKTDIAGYLPAYGAFVYRPSSGGADVVVPFGIAGAGQSIPAPGDYDGDGKTDVAVYLPTLGILAYRPSSGGNDVLIHFGSPGSDQSVPAPGDYDGDGKTDTAVYLPALGDLAYRPSAGGADVLVPFGIAGAGQTVPAPGDYDGDGKTDIAAYLPSLGVFAYRPSSGGSDVITSFGVAGTGASIPAPGDYDSDGKTDVAIYLPQYGLFAYRPSSGGSDVLIPFGPSGTGQTVPASSISYGQSATATATSVAAAAVAVEIPLAEDLTESGSTVATRKKSRPYSA